MLDSPDDERRVTSIKCGGSVSVPAGGLRILLATDGSQGSVRAEAYACALAQSWGASLTVMSVLEFPPGMNPDYAVNRLYLDELMQETTTRLVDVTARAGGLGLLAQSRIATGIPSEEVLAVAGAEDADLVVVGTRGKTGLEHVLLGSTAERIIRMAPCPVLTVPAGKQRAGERLKATFTRMLVPVDFSDCSRDALEYGALIAQRWKTSLKLFHVLEPVSYGLDFTLPQMAHRESSKTAITKRLSDFVSALTSLGLVSDFLISGGLPADSILDAARAQSVDVIVMGTHGRRGVSHALFGSVTESVLRRSSCPVLTVRSLKLPPDHRRILSGLSMPPTV
ncbi:MAG: universal stress protein [Nitrospira sp.]|nr:MAG: universal stress protein [Nitrospira sp.]